MSNFYTDVIKKSPLFNKAEPVNSLDLLEPVTRRKVQAIVSDAASHGVKLCVNETYRSQALQEKYFREGNTQIRTVGVHHFGLAADIVPLDAHGNPTWSPPESTWHLLAHLAHVHGLITGQDWGRPGVEHKFIDAPHVQRVAVSDQAKLFAGEWYPDEIYDPYKP